MGTASRYGSVSGDARQKPGLIDLPSDAMEPGWASPWPELSDDGASAHLRDNGTLPEHIRDTDGDGIPDLWEISHALNPLDPADGNAMTLSPSGYTNLEVYLNSLVQQPAAASSL